MEAGAIVLADTGVLCIDEYDKLKQSAQKSLNEPMEQSSVSASTIAPASIVHVPVSSSLTVDMVNPA